MVARACSAVVVVAAILRGCGAPTPRRASTALALPSEGERFAGRVRLDATFAGSTLPRLEVHADLWALTRRAHEVELRVRVHGSETLDDVLVRLDETGAVRDVRSLCGDPTVDELSTTRWARALLATGPTLAHGLPTDRGVLSLPIGEGATPLSIRERDDLEGRGTVPLAADLAGARYEGELDAHVRMQMGSVLLRRVRARLRGTVEATTASGTGHGELVLALDAQLIRADGAAPPPPTCGEVRASEPTEPTASACEEPVDGFDMQAVVRMINSRRLEITHCYEIALGSDPTLAGRVRVSITIEPSGETTRVRVVEDTLGSPPAATCIVAVLEDLHFDPAPTCGPVTYAFPFVFESAR